MRMPIRAEEKIAVTLRYLATGETFESLSYQFRIHRSTISQFIPVVCKAIYETLKPDYLAIPDTEEEWLELCKKTNDRWQFPNSFAAADGKHIGLFHPHGSGSEFYNYKGFYSLVLLALVDYDYKFLYIDVGCQGRISDGGVFRNSTLFHALENDTLNLPQPSTLQFPEEWIYDFETPGVPFMLVGDDAFTLTKYCMKPFPQRNLTDRKRIFNYRLSRFRRVTENAFGIMCCRFRLFLNRCSLVPENAVYATLAAIVLHNMLRTKSAESYTPSNFIDEETETGIVPGEWRNEINRDVLQPLPQIRNYNHSKKDAESVRNYLADYFYGPGQVEWQWKTLL